MILKTNDVEAIDEPPNLQDDTEYRLPINVDRNANGANAHF